jgi:hypothetical protein
MMDYAFLSLWIMPFGIVLLVRTIPRQWRGLRSAATRAEKAYWILNMAGCLVAAYGAMTAGLVMVDEFRGGPWRLAIWWPSLARCWWDVGDRTIIALLDLLIALTAGLVLICAARYFGYVDESDVWCKGNLLDDRDAAPASSDTVLHLHDSSRKAAANSSERSQPSSSDR